MSELILAAKRAPFSAAEARSRADWDDQLLDALPIGICMCDQEGALVRYNQRAAELWGRAPALSGEKHRYCGAFRILRPDGKPIPADEAPAAEALRTDLPVVDREIVIERPDGTRITALTTSRPLHSKTGEMIGAVSCFQAIAQRASSEQRLRQLASEMDHRAKNMLAAIQAVIHLTQAGSVPEFKRAIEGRVSALSRAHALLSSGQWEGADLRRIVHDELAQHSGGETLRVSVEGPPLTVPAQLAQSLALIVHELATNALKHGAIGRPERRIDLRWWRAPGDRLLIRWTESGGAAVQPPSRKGFGISIIEGAVRQQLRGTLEMDWREDGLRCEIEVPLS
jgi:two-component sensor histidine kinase